MKDELTRKERRSLERLEKKSSKGGGMKSKIFAVFVLAAIALLFAYFFSGSSSSTNTDNQPGEAVEDLGRDHVADIAGIEYSSNPPSSGPHFPIWAKKGVYDRLISDGYLIHSLEHGYIVISYDCSHLEPSAFSLVPAVSAHDEGSVDENGNSGEKLMHMNFTPEGSDSWFTPENPPDEEVALPQAFRSDACQSLALSLSLFTDEWERLIVVPRTDMDTTIALTAWNRIDKMDEVDHDRIEKFISVYHNKGPEQTTE